MELFLQGLVLGFSIAAPVGPIGILCIRRTLAEGRASGFVSGLGAATADAVYGSIAAFGLTIISGILVEQKIWLGLLGGAFLCYLGVRTLLASPAQNVALAQGQVAPGGAIVLTAALAFAVAAVAGRRAARRHPRPVGA